MSPTIGELMQALPDVDEQDGIGVALPAVLKEGTLRPVPIGRWRRLTLLGSLQAKIAAAYLFYWIRGWFKSADQNSRLLAETHWRTAARVLDSMGYLRGAVMKIGQTLANFPDIAPREFVETLEKLHFDAPAMHWSLLREMVFSELGDDPENLFAEFDKQAFAAASLGQVHRARLKTGEEVAVKIQYPGIARSIGEDFRNLMLFMLPNRLGHDWKNVQEQFEDLRIRLEQETDYCLEATYLQKARTLFREEDGIVVPRVYPQYSTARVLTMDLIRGVHMDPYLDRQPSQEERNEAGRKMVRAWYRLMYAGRMLYNDFHPGNFLFLEDGRLGLIDFGYIMDLDEELWQMFQMLDRPLTTGQRSDRIAAMKEWSGLTDDSSDQMRLYDEFAEWSWCSRDLEGPFDFGDEADFRRGVDLFTEMVRKRYSRGHRTTPTIARGTFGWRSLLYRLKANIEIRPLAESEIVATGWDRSEYTRPIAN
ncbi:MAG: AarF/ABC1/UbiB kinase family protein [Planctomycetes bacterium]|nr:AarF/ABC1/UbiB kinase family protein [Planctomycetota bacterium]